MSRPIVHGTALVPLLRFPRGGDFHLAVVMDEDLDLDTHTIAVRLRSRYGVERPVFLATEDGTGITKSGQTATIRLSPDLADETEDSDLTLTALQLQSGNAYRVDFLDGDGDLALRLQGDLDWLPEEGAWDDEPASVSTLPTINVALSNGAVSVTVALVTQGGGSVDSAAVVEAIGENPAAARTALELGSAAEEDAEAFAAADDARLTDARTPTAHKTSHAIGGSDALSPADIGAATSDHAHEASVITYAPASDEDWDEAEDPGNVDAALDQLAARAKALESAGGGSVVNLLDGAESFGLGSGWTDQGGGVYESNNAAGSFESISWVGLDLEDGALYLLRFFVVAKTSGQIATFLGTNGSATAVPTSLQWWETDAQSWSGYLHIKHTPAQADNLIIRANNGFVGTISNVSLVKLAGLPG